MLLVGVWANQNWILGNWIKEVRTRSSENFDIRWVPSIYAQKRKFEKLAHIPLPRRSSYFFSYVTIFEHYLNQDVPRFSGKSIVLYPHNEIEMGTLEHQVKILNQAFKTYFFCSTDAEQLVAHGLMRSKVEIAHCAVDVDCVFNPIETKSSNTVILASRFGPRKGLSILPEIVRTMPHLKFIALGRGWEGFISDTRLNLLNNFDYYPLNKATRNEFFSRAGIFLSLSNLEGGPVPLIEAIAMGCVPVVTRTGFAPDLIQHNINGFLLKNPPEVSEVRAALASACLVKVEPILGFLTWDRITQLMIRDKRLMEREG